MTSRYHQWRARRVFERLLHRSGVRLAVAAVPPAPRVTLVSGGGRETALFRKLKVLRELAAIALYWARGDL